MWLGTLAVLVAVAGEKVDPGPIVVDPNNPNVVYAEAQEALVVRGTLVEPALPFGLATVVLNNLDVADDSSLLVTVLESEDGVPSLTSAEVLDAAADFDNDGDVDGRDFLVWQRGSSPAADGDGDVDGQDFLIWQRQLGAQISAGDLAAWQSNYGSTYAAIAEESWLSAELPEVDDEVLETPPKALEFIGFEVQQDGKTRGALLWEVRTTAKGNTEVVSHLWTTAAFEPVLDPTEELTLAHVGFWDSVPAFLGGVVVGLESDPITTYEQGSEVVLKKKSKLDL